jgi:hypothetical protein
VTQEPLVDQACFGYLNEQADKLRDTTEAIIKKGKAFMGHG